MPSFSQTEQAIITTLSKNNNFIYNGIIYEIKKFGKPTTRTGEPKTDIYILAENDLNILEFKISVKQSNADFLENKMRAERAKEIFGDTWKKDIIELTKNLEDNFLSKQVIYKEKVSRTEKGCLTLGWKFEILNKPGGDLSGKVPKSLLEEVITGKNLSLDKKNAMVDGKVIKNSGIANYILLDAELLNLEDLNLVINSIIPVKDYIDSSSSDIYFACKALNYRTMYLKNGATTYSHKWDGNRPLSVYVDWKNLNGQLCYEICFDNPLVTKGNEVAKKLSKVLSELNIKTTDDISKNNTCVELHSQI